MNKGREVLRDLPRRYVAACARPEQAKRRDLWRKHNSLKETPPPIYTRAFAWKEMPESRCACEDALFRHCEDFLRHQLFWDSLNDDSVFEPWVTVRAVLFTNFYVAYFDRMFAAAPGRIDILRVADDLGMQDRLLVSPKLFEQFVALRLRRLVDMAHSHGVKVMFHSCGAIVPLIDGIIAAGVDILDPIQVTAQGMDPKFLKERFGRRICLHGTIDTQYLLPQGSPEDVRRTVREMIGVLGPLRVMAPVMAMGEAAGLAAAQVVRSDIPFMQVDVQALRAALRAQQAIVDVEALDV